MKPRISRSLLLAAALILPLSACSAQPGTFLPGASRDATAPLTEVGPGDAGAAAQDSEAAVPDAASEKQTGRSMIRTGDVSLEVADPAAAAERVAQVAERLDGSVESSTVHRSSGEFAGGADVTLRVPEDRLDEAFDALAEVGEVLSQSRSEVDVTSEHVDLQARVAALESSVERLTELMRGAATTSELLEAESALSQRQQELDGLRAQLKALEGQVDEATLHVSLQARSALPGGGPSNFWEGVLAGIDSLGAAAAGALVLAGILAPWLLVGGVIAVAIVLIVRAARRRRSRRAAPVSPPPHPEL